MEWIKAAIKTEPKNIEIVCAILLNHGIEGVEIIDPQENMRFLNEDEAQNWDYIDEDLLAKDLDDFATVQFFMPADDTTGDHRSPLQGLRLDLKDFGELSAQTVEDDWSDAWLQYYKPFKIGKKIVVRPHWEEYLANDGEIVFTIDPGHVFGTGQHQSTALCIRLLDKHVEGGENLLDIGCGSGILSIISLLLGASCATAIDIDPQAVKMTGTNADLNSVTPERLQALTGNILLDNNFYEKIVQNAPYQIITANIVADIIIALAPIAAKLIAINGKFIVGGIIDDREEEVKSALQAAGFAIDEIMTQDNWVAIYAQRI
ncbi:MAG: 50S ribosomal protein L11 methyltransferase [Defluviitaleaceae bacterium]|nr:50S ribosomal protein L11 methyltransferase [Defluviitaleaceae bacterium]